LIGKSSLSSNPIPFTFPIGGACLIEAIARFTQTRQNHFLQTDQIDLRRSLMVVSNCAAGGVGSSERPIADDDGQADRGAAQGDVRHLRAQGDKMVAEQAPDTGVLKTAEMVGLGTGAVQRLKREMAAAA
jgi:hypothetical protein